MIAATPMWNDTDIPIAHLISFRCYGTWLHGDERGSINRFNNAYQSPYMEPNEGWKNYNAAKLKSEPVTLSSAQRNVVNTAVREVCEYKHWLLHAISIRTNHGHSVVSIGEASSKAALNAFRAYATRYLRSSGLWAFPTALGLIKEADDRFGMKRVFIGRSIMLLMAKVGHCPTLINGITTR